MPLKMHDRFELIEQLGEGASAVVWRARDSKLNRNVALKILSGISNTSPTPDQDEREQRFEQETQAAARLNHPNIVGLLEAGSANGSPHIAYELIEGVTLREWVNFVGPKPIELAVAIVQLADALDYAHNQGVVHRDIKPENILVELNGKPYVTDFGLAQIADKRITEADVSVGTVAYLAPEQASYGAIDGRADVFALGVVLFEMLTGELPFRATTRAEYLAQLTLSDAPEPTTLNRDIHPDLAAICSKCLSRSPARRYSSARYLREDLERYTRGQPTRARPQSWLSRSGRKISRHAKSLAITAACIAAIAVTYMVTIGMKNSQRVAERVDQIAREIDDAELELLVKLVQKEGISAGIVRKLRSRNPTNKEDTYSVSTLYALSQLDALHADEIAQLRQLAPRLLPRRARSLESIIQSISPADFERMCANHLDSQTSTISLDTPARELEWIAIALLGGIAEPAQRVIEEDGDQRMRFRLQSLLAECNLTSKQWLKVTECGGEDSQFVAWALISAADSIAEYHADSSEFSAGVSNLALPNCLANLESSLRYTSIKLEQEIQIKAPCDETEYRSLDNLPLLRVPPGQMESNDMLLRVDEPFWAATIEIPQSWVKSQFPDVPEMAEAIEGIEQIRATPESQRQPGISAHRISVAAAMRICNRLSELDGRQQYYVEINSTNPLLSKTNPASTGFRIPTTIQWEWMTRAGSKTPFFHGAKIGSNETNRLDFNDFGWFQSSQENQRDSSFQAGGLKRPNAWGLFDVYGNVFEIAFDANSNSYVGCGGGIYFDGRKCTSQRIDPIPTSFSYGLRPICPITN